MFLSVRKCSLPLCHLSSALKALRGGRFLTEASKFCQLETFFVGSEFSRSENFASLVLRFSYFFLSLSHSLSLSLSLFLSRSLSHTLSRHSLANRILCQLTQTLLYFHQGRFLELLGKGFSTSERGYGFDSCRYRFFVAISPASGFWSKGAVGRKQLKRVNWFQTNVL